MYDDPKTSSFALLELYDGPKTSSSALSENEINHKSDRRELHGRVRDIMEDGRSSMSPPFNFSDKKKCL